MSTPKIDPAERLQNLRLECIRIAARYCEARLVAGEKLDKAVSPLALGEQFFQWTAGVAKSKG